MAHFAGQWIGPRGVEARWVEVRNGRIVATGPGDPPMAPQATGWLVPGPVNAHTHIGDTFLRDRPKPRGLAELVGPGGWKSQALAAATREERVAGMVAAVADMQARGTAGFLDFREGGLAGVAEARDAMRMQTGAPPHDLGTHPPDGEPGKRDAREPRARREDWQSASTLRAPEVGLPTAALRRGTSETASPVSGVVGKFFARGRTPGFHEDEATAVLNLADGIGISAVRDVGVRTAREWAEAAHEARKPFALHVSEGAREPIEEVVALQPAFVVHATHATRHDWSRLADANIPVVIAPRSNAYFGIKTPVDAMLACGLQLAIGTDNGMLHPFDLLEELGQLAAWYPEVPASTWLTMLAQGRPLAGLPWAVPRVGDVADLLVLPQRPWSVPAHRPRLAPRTLADGAQTHHADSA